MNFIILIVSILIFSCTTTIPNSETILVSHQWKLVNSISNEPADLKSNGEFTTELFKQYPPCSIDDLYNFENTGKFVKNDNIEICQTPTINTGSWKILNEDSLYIDFGIQNIVMTFKIERISNGDLILKTRHPIGSKDVVVSYFYKAVK